MELVKKFLKGVPVDLIVTFVRQYALGTLKNPQSKGYQTAKSELVALAKDTMEKWPEEF
jgi:hypothetical protein